jgi:hypothetical protein
MIPFTHHSSSHRSTFGARWLLILVAFLGFALNARAQSVRWETADSGDPAELVLFFQDCAPESEPQLPKIDGVTLSFLGRSEQTSMVNFSVSRTVMLSYRIRSGRSGPITIPSFTVQTNKGTLRVPAFSGGTPRSASDVNITARLEPGSLTVWAGEIFPLTYTLDAPRRSLSGYGPAMEWDATPLVVEEWSKWDAKEAVAGDRRVLVTTATRAYAKTPGPISLNAASQLVNIQTGNVNFGLFQTPRVEQLSVTTDRPSLVVRALPAGAPEGFNGAVGQFKFTSKVVPTTANVGEPVTWTVELSGTGNWPDITGLPQREVSKDFNVVQPQAKRTPAEGKLFDVTLSEDVVLVPTRAGNYTLGPLTFVFFDPTSGTYQTASTPATRITINAPAPSPTSPAITAPTSGAEELKGPGETTAKPHVELKAPAAPSGIPREPLSGSDAAIVPIRTRSLVAWTLAPFAILPVLWTWLAIRRAKQTDPIRARREAKERIAAAIGKLRTFQGATLTPDAARILLEWQHDTTLLWQIPHAAPAASALGDPAWAVLWTEADRALYGANGQLPADWATRAQAALASKTVPGFRPYTALLPRNLFPFVASFALIGIVTPFLLAQEAATASAAAAYRKGEFAAAEKTWADQIAKLPTDPIVRHNLSLALAQQDHWGEAAAHATAAFVQQPANPAMRWQLGLAAEKAGYIPASLAGFFPAGPVQSVARLAAPGAWQRILIASSFLAVGALSLLLLEVYYPWSRVRVAAGIALLGLAMLSGLASLAGLHAYGTMTDENACVVWHAGVLRSIPTEADTTQKTTALAAGSVGVVEKDFLGWVRLGFENGQTGWVRKEEVIGIWK